MDNLYEILKVSWLFKGLDKEIMEDNLKNINFKVLEYTKDDIVALEGDVCNKIGIVLSGAIEIKKLYASGKNITIDNLQKGNVFGEVIVFSDMSVYPSTILCSKPAKIIFITKDQIIKLFSLNNQILINFMTILSNKIIMLNNKIKNLSYQTIRQKIVHYILDQYKLQRSSKITLPNSKKDLAEMLGIPRPSLSRELGNMRDEGLIDFSKDKIKILNIEELESILLE